MFHRTVVAAFVGLLALASPALAARVVGPRQLSFTMKTEGRVSQHGTVTISPDGKTLTELFWEPGQEAHPSRGVYVREP